MRKIPSRILSLLLAVWMALSFLPVPALAAVPELSEARATNAVTFPGLGFQERFFYSGVNTMYYPAFDAASGTVMYCVDPGKIASTDPSTFTVTIANGANVPALLQQAMAGSMLGNAPNKTLAQMERDLRLSQVFGPDFVARTDITGTDLLLQMMSVLNMHRHDGKYSSSLGSNYGTDYNSNAVFAVQLMAWYLCYPEDRVAGMSVIEYKISQLDQQTQDELMRLFYAILTEVKELYYDSVSSFRVLLPEGMRDTLGTASDAENGSKVVQIGEPGEGDYRIAPASQADFTKIRYVSINDGPVQNFTAGCTASRGEFAITNNGTSLHVRAPDNDTYYTVRFLTTNSKESAGAGGGSDDWAIYAQASRSSRQSFFTAYKAPKVADMYLSFKYETEELPTFPLAPAFRFSQHKYDSVGGFDGDDCTPVGDTNLAASFRAAWSTDLGTSGSVTSSADRYGHGASETILPWGELPMDEAALTEEEIIGWYTPEAEGEEEPEPIEFVKGYTWDGSCTVTITERGAPEGHHGSSTTYTHRIVYHAETSRSAPDDNFSPISYTIKVDGRDTGLSSGSAIMATWDAPYSAASGEAFYNEHWDGALQIVKEKDGDDIFSEEDGKGTIAGGVAGGKEYSTKSQWTLRLIDSGVYDAGISAAEAAELFGGYEDCPYVKVVEDSALQSTAIGRLMHCYKTVLNGGGTPADEKNPLTPSRFGQIYVSGLPYGTYLLTEIKADGDRYVKESMFFTISEDEQIVSTDIVNTSKVNVVKVVKVDSETGKTVPSAGTAFRIRYMGSPEYDDPSQTPNYGRYLPNAGNLNASVTHAEDYIFCTDAAGEVTIPYELPYGTYQLEEILVPEGYYIGVYGEDGTASSAGGTADSYGPGGDNHQTTGSGTMDFEDRVAIYDKNGNRIDYTTDENVVYNAYTFEVTKQADHVDGEDYQTYYLTVEIQNTAAKGKVQISKLGERLVGFRETTDEYGNVISEPVYESVPLEGAVFGIYAAEDILLEDGEEPSIAYDALTGEEIKLVTDVLNHVQFPGAKVIRSGIHEASGAEVVYTIQRDQSENNLSTVEYLTPAQKGTRYTAQFSRYDADGALTYDYEVEFALEYAAGGWNYTDIHVRRTITSDDYTPYITDELPSLYNGEAEVPWKSAVYGNRNKLELDEPLVNEYNYDANAYEIQVHSGELMPVVPSIEDMYDMSAVIGMPELPEGYSLDQITNTRVTAVNDGDVNDVLVAVITEDEETQEEEIVWEPLSEADADTWFAPRYGEESVTNMPELPGDVEFLFASAKYFYVQDEDGTVKIVYSDEQGGISCHLEDRSDIVPMVPDDVPEGYVYLPGHGPIIADMETEDGDTLYKVYVLDTETGEYRWLDSDGNGMSYKQRVQEFKLTLTQHNTSEDGWTFAMDGLVLTNRASNEETADAVITLPYDVEPQITSYLGCDVVTETLEGGIGTQTSITVKHPTAPVYFSMIDGSHVEMVHLGGYTKTTITVPAANELPYIRRGGKEIDFFNWANGGLGPDNNSHEVLIDEYNYVRTTRHEADAADGETYYVIELVSSAQTEEDAFVVDYHGSYESLSTVITDAVTGAQRGSLQLRSIYKTMRYPMSSLVETITTGPDGMAVSSLLPLGDYIIRELDCPDGFVASSVSYPFTLAYRDQFTPLVWASAEVDNGAVSVQLDITKGFQQTLNGDDYIPKAGAVFGVYTYGEIGGLPADTLVATVTVDQNGKAVQSVKLPMGDYYVQELSTLDGYEVNDTRFLFRADDSVKSGNLEFSYESDGIFGKISHSGYKTVDVEITTYVQIPMPGMTVNDIRYDLDQALEPETVGNQVLVENAADTDRSTFRITGTEDKPITVLFENGAKLVVTVTEGGYTAQFIDSSVSAVVDTPAAVTEIASDQGRAYKYDPLIAFTGYTAETSTIYTAPQTRLTASNGTSLEFSYDLVNGVKKAVITYPSAYEYYSNDELPVKDVSYTRGDINMDGTVDEADRVLLNSWLSGGSDLTENQLILADLDGNDSVGNDDLTALAEAIATNKELGQVTVKEAYLPDNAILFETEGFGNNAYVGTEVDRTARTVTVDLSKLTCARTVTVGGAVAFLDGDVIRLEGGAITAENTESHQKVTNGYQPDGLTLSDGNTLTSGNRTLSLTSAAGGAEVSLDIHYDHSYMDVKLETGSITAAWLNDTAESTDIFAEGLRMLPGNTATLVCSDNSVYHVELSNTGYAAMSVEGIVNGDLPYRGDIPTLKVNGSPDNFIGVDHSVILQTMPMDRSSLDDIRQNNIKNVTLARGDSFIRQLQVKINAAGRPDNQLPGQDAVPDTPAGGGEPTRPIPNDLRPWITKRDATTGKELPGAWIEITDAQGGTVAAGYSNAEGKFYFEKPEPGSYTFREISAPAGYQVNEEVFSFVVHPDGTITGDDTILDYPIPGTPNKPEQPKDPEQPEEPEPPVEEIEEPDVPLDPGPADPEDPVEELEDPDVPLSNVPQTGDDTGLWLLAAMVSGTGLVCVLLTKKRGRSC